MQYGMRSHFIPWSMLLVLSCSSTVAPSGLAGSPIIRLQKSLPDRYPPEDFLSDAACSREGVEAASILARKRVSEQVQSRLEGVTHLSTIAGSGSGGNWGRSELATDVRIDTAFEEADLIRIDPGSLVQSDGETCLAAWLSRDDLRQRLKQRWREAGDTLDASFRRATRASAASPEPTDVAMAFRDARSALANTVSIDALWTSLLPGAPPEVDKALVRRREMLALAARVRAETENRRTARASLKNP